MGLTRKEHLLKSIGDKLTQILAIERGVAVFSESSGVRIFLTGPQNINLTSPNDRKTIANLTVQPGYYVKNFEPAPLGLRYTGKDTRMFDLSMVVTYTGSKNNLITSAYWAKNWQGPGTPVPFSDQNSIMEMETDTPDTVELVVNWWKELSTGDKISVVFGANQSATLEILHGKLIISPI